MTPRSLYLTQIWFGIRSFWPKWSFGPFWTVLVQYAFPQYRGQRAQRSKKFEISIEIENFDREWKFRASHQPRHYFLWEIETSRLKVSSLKIKNSIEIKNFDRDRKCFWSLGPLGIQIAAIAILRFGHPILGPLNGPLNFGGGVFHRGRLTENSPLALVGRFPSLRGRFPTLMGHFPGCVNVAHCLEESPLLFRQRLPCPVVAFPVGLP